MLWNPLVWSVYFRLNKVNWLYKTVFRLSENPQNGSQRVAFELVSPAEKLSEIIITQRNISYSLGIHIKRISKTFQNF